VFCASTPVGSHGTTRGIWNKFQDETGKLYGLSNAVTQENSLFCGRAHRKERDSAFGCAGHHLHRASGHLAHLPYHHNYCLLSAISLQFLPSPSTSVVVVILSYFEIFRRHFRIFKNPFHIYWISKFQSSFLVTRHRFQALTIVHNMMCFI